MPTETKIDIALFGATGFVGRLTARHLYRRCREEGLTFAIAGRHRRRLRALAEEIAQEAGDSAVAPAIRVASTEDATSLTSLARGTEVLCSTVGPYARLGTEVVSACVQEGTDYCDLTGEVQWMRRMIDRFDAVAKEQGARIVHAAGFDSIPSDLGVLVTQKRMIELRGRPASKLQLRVHRQAGGVSRGTLDSMVQLVKEARREPWIRKLLRDPHSLEPDWHPPGERGPGQSWKDPARGNWTLPFLMEGVNRRVVHRSNALSGYPWGRDFQYRELFLLSPSVKGLFTALLGRLLLAIGPGLMAFPPTGALISATLFPKAGEGPKLAREGGGSFEVKIEQPETGEAVVSIAADRDPGYGATAIMLGETAVLLSQTRKGDGSYRSVDHAGPERGVRGGVLTPASALGSVLADRLTAAGVRFTVEL